MKNKDVVYLLIASLATAILWLAFDLYHSYTVSKISDDYTQIVIPITPKIDQETIDMLKIRHEIPVERQGDFIKSTVSANKKT